MDRYNEIMKGKKRLAILFTFVLIAGVAMIVARFVIDIKVLFIPGIVLTVVGIYTSSILWAVIQNDRIFDEKIITAITANNITSINELNARFKIDVDKLIKRIEYLVNKGCFPDYTYDKSYGLRGKNENIKSVNNNNVEEKSTRRENLAQCSNCGASIYDENGFCPYCGAKK